MRGSTASKAVKSPETSTRLEVLRVGTWKLVSRAIRYRERRASGLSTSRDAKLIPSNSQVRSTYCRPRLTKKARLPRSLNDSASSPSHEHSKVSPGTAALAVESRRQHTIHTSACLKSILELRPGGISPKSANQTEPRQKQREETAVEASAASTSSTMATTTTTRRGWERGRL